MNKNKQITLAALAGILLIVLIPVQIRQTFNGPKEEARYIRRVHDNHSVGQSFTNEYPVHRIDILARAANPQQSTLLVKDEQGTKLAIADISLTTDDTWFAIPLEKPLPAGKHQLIFTSPASLGQENAILIRFQIESDFYETGSMIIDGKESYGDIAFQTYTKAPAWKALLIWGQITDKSLLVGTRYTIIGVLLAALLVWLESAIKKAEGKKQNIIITSVIAVVTILAILVRLPYVFEIQGVFGGDAFNYLSKAVALTEGDDPFASDPRKGPLYSFLILPGLFTDDPLMFSRLVGVVASSITAGLIVLIGRALKLPWSIAAGAGIILALNKDTIWEAPSGLANSLYMCLVAASTLAFLKSGTAERHSLMNNHATAGDSSEVSGNVWKWQWILVVLLGLTFLARYEGALVAAVYLPALWVREKFPLKRAAFLAVVTLAIMLIPQVSYLWSGEPGIRTVSDIQADGGLSLAGNIKEYQGNIDKLRGFAISTWMLPEHDNLIIPALWWGIGGGLLLILFKKRFPKRQANLTIFIAIGSLVALFLIFSMKNEQAFGYIAAIPWLLTGLGIPYLVAQRKYQAATVITMVIIQIAFITLILPKPRYYLQIIPYLALAIATGSYIIISWKKTWYARGLAIVFIGMFASFLYTQSAKDMEIIVERYNFDARRSQPIIQAALATRQQDAKVAYLGQDEPPIKTLIKGDNYVFLNPKESHSVEEEVAFIQDKNVGYLMQRNEEVVWNIVTEKPELVNLWQTFTAPTGESVSVYRVK